MKLRQMQCLTTLAACGFNVSRAADALHATQPAIGKQLRQFEEELGVTLFVKRGARIVGLTRSGEDILHWCRVALQAAGNIHEIARDAAQRGRGAVTLATTHTHARYIIIDAIRAFAQAQPEVALHLLQGTPERVVDLVREAKADIGITTRMPQPPDEVVQVPFRDVGKVLLLPAGHPLATQDPLTLEAIAAYPLISNNVERPTGASVQGIFRSAGVNASFRVEALDADVMKSYVRAGLGIAIIPEVAFDPEVDQGLQARPLASPFEATTSCVFLRRGAYLSQSAHAFLQRLSPQLSRERLQESLSGEIGAG